MQVGVTYKDAYSSYTTEVVPKLGSDTVKELGWDPRSLVYDNR